MMLVTRHTINNSARIKHQIQQAFEELTGEKNQTNWTPAVEMQETPESYIVRVIVPGLNKENLEIEATKQAVAISGKTHYQELPEDHKYLYSEFPIGQFRRVICLPKQIVNTEVKADYQDGIVTINIPKTIEAIRQIVKVNLKPSQATEKLEGTETKIQESDQ